MLKVKLMELLHDLSALIRRIPREDDGRILSHRACRVLTILNEQGNMNQRTLAAKIAIRPQSLSEVIYKIEKDGYITKTEDKANKKANLIVLTQKGKEEADIAQERIAKHANKFLDALTEDEVKTLIKLIEKVIRTNGIDRNYISEEKQCKK